MDTAPTEIEDILREWIRYYHTTRGIGHTQAAISGVPKNGYLVTHNHTFARSVRPIKTMVYSRVDALCGLNAPVSWDNCALIELFIQTSRRIESLKAEVKEQETRAELAESRITAVTLAREAVQRRFNRAFAVLKALFRRTH